MSLGLVDCELLGWNNPATRVILWVPQVCLRVGDGMKCDAKLINRIHGPSQNQPHWMVVKKHCDGTNCLYLAVAAEFLVVAPTLPLEYQLHRWKSCDSSAVIKFVTKTKIKEV